MIEKPSEQESEYFARIEAAKRLEAQVKRTAEMAAEEKKRLKDQIGRAHV